MKKNQHLVFKWVLGGVLLGIGLVAVSWTVAIVSHGSSRTIMDALNDQPTLWVTNTAPLVFGLIGAVIGGAHAKLAGIQAQTQDLAERVAKEWTAEIHEGNVNTAKTAELRSKFFAALSHDMRTPLTAILGYTDLAEDPDAGIDEETVHEFLRDIGDSARQLLKIIGDLMDAAKMEAGRIELMVDDVDGDEIADQVSKHMSALAEEEKLELVTDLRAGVPVRADQQRFRQILINLISNALKYTAEGTVTVRSYQAGELIVYEVDDTGYGISAEDMPKVFTAFEQTDAAKQRIDSTGLGLPVSLGMAQAMGGTIQATSLGAGHGSTFRLVLLTGTGEEMELKMASLPQLLAA
ncbi:MAG: HAMP domain-containing histidine kinase [bacterium]|nr:HAMP domain-containing histidine kinase [bacterium]